MSRIELSVQRHAFAEENSEWKAVNDDSSAGDWDFDLTTKYPNR